MALSAGDRVGPYEIVGSLGAGGMGVVYQARDTRLNRLIALKTLSGERADNEEYRKRFLREAQSASQLNHPNIITIHESLEEGGEFFLVMEYVAGTTLEARLAKSLLSIAEATSYTTQIADGLAAAHRAGIIHRDLKPANIMITDDGRVKLLDFGLARFMDHALPEDEATVTRTLPGTVMGTAPYMSPEQAQGHMLDQRSDIFSFGCVLYEMFAGKRAFIGGTFAATIAEVLRGEPTLLRQVRATVPAVVEQSVLRCLRKDPNERFATMLEFQKTFASTSTRGGGKSDKTSIAVLPFANLSSDKENEYFSDGLAEEVLNALTKVKELRVIARTSAFAVRDKEHDLQTIGQKLRVDTVLEGSVRRAANRIRVTAQLISIEDESHMWSERYDRELIDVFAIQDDISQEIAAALKVKLAPQEESRPANIEAYQCYLKGIYWFQRYTAQSLVLAKESFEQALAYDPNYAPAHAGLAVFFYSMGALSLQRMSDVGPLAKASAMKALALNADQSEAHSVLGLLAGAFQHEWSEAAARFEAALHADPVPPLVRLRYGLYYLLPMGRFEDAALQFHLALETDPLSMMVHFGLSFALYSDKRYEEAANYAAKAVELYPDYWLVHFALGMAQSQQGHLQEAIRSCETALRLSPSFALATGYLAALLGRTGEVDEAHALIRELEERRVKTYVSSSAFAVYYAAMGEVESMFESLKAALAEREPFLTRLDAEPYFWPYRSDPRYEQLLRDMKLR